MVRNTAPMFRTVLRGLSTVLIVAGSLLILDAGITLAWQEPITAIYAQIQQDQLGSDLKHLEAQALTAPVQRALHRLASPTKKIAFLARNFRRTVKEGHALGRIKIPRIGASFVVVQGTGTGDLQKGPGHYPSTPLPGMSGTVGIAGHRTTYLAPFRHVDSLKPGDPITIDMPYGRFTYNVERTRIVKPTALWITQPVGYPRLVLSACHPLYSASNRIVVFARLVSEVPRGQALASGVSRAAVAG
jgi:sortase A